MTESMKNWYHDHHKVTMALEDTNKFKVDELMDSYELFCCYKLLPPYGQRMSIRKFLSTLRIIEPRTFYDAGTVWFPKG